MMLAQSIAVVVVLLLLASAGNADADGYYWDGNKLKGGADAQNRIDANRSRNSDWAEAAGFIGYVVGVTDTLNGTRLCPGMKVPVGQLIGVVTKYLQGVPEEWNLPASTIVLRALEPVFPCKK